MSASKSDDAKVREDAPRRYAAPRLIVHGSFSRLTGSTKGGITAELGNTKFNSGQ